MAGIVSTRATPFFRQESNYGLPQILQYGNLFNPDSNPTGALCMAISENNVSRDLVLDKIRESVVFTTDVCNYTNSTGLPQFKTCIKDLVKKYVWKECDIQNEDLVCASGCVALLHQLAVLLFEAGDAVMIPTPFYPAFIHDFKNVGGVSVVDICMSPTCRITKDLLEQTLIRGRERGTPPKALLLCNPCNPTGRIYNREEFDICLEFCRRHRIHIICDEVYALTVYEEGVFTSWATLAHRQELSGLVNVGQGKTDSDAGEGDNFYADHMHFLWSISKDFCGSGMRVGVLYSKNKELVRACCSMNDMCMISNIAQQVLLPVLSDHLWIDYFLETNRNRLRECYKTLVSGLAELSINVCPADGGLFVFVDLQSLFLLAPTTSTQDAAKDISKDINDPAGFYSQEIELECRLRELLIFATPGRACHCPIPGWFRLCYAWTSLAAVKELVSRITAVSRKVRESRKEVDEL